MEYLCLEWIDVSDGSLSIEAQDGILGINEPEAQTEAVLTIMEIDAGQDGLGDIGTNEADTYSLEGAGTGEAEGNVQESIEDMPIEAGNDLTISAEIPNDDAAMQAQEISAEEDALQMQETAEEGPSSESEGQQGDGAAEKGEITEADSQNVMVTESQAQASDDSLSFAEGVIEEMPEDIAAASATIAAESPGENLAPGESNDMDDISVTDNAETITIQPEDWYFDIYYVNQDDRNFVEKTNDFQLKYQMEFRNSVDIPAGWAEVRIPSALFIDRYGNSITPSDIGAPYGTPESPSSSKVTSFNYWIDEGTGELVFFNYKDIPAGMNNAWQVLYKDVKAIDAVDMTLWELQAQVTLQIDSSENPAKETRTPESLRGQVDTGVTLQSVTKTAYTVSGASHTPGLYTEKQILKYTPNAQIPENFDDYVYVVWKITSSGSVTQDWEMYLNGETWYETGGVRTDGEIIGIQALVYNKTGSSYTKRDDIELVETGEFAGSYAVSSYQDDFKENGRDDIRLGYYVVCAYPAGNVITNETIMYNTANMTLHPADGIDDDQAKNVSASWTYHNYVWKYVGDGPLAVDKWIGDFVSKNKNLKGWTGIYDEIRKEGGSLGGMDFIINTSCVAYQFTHKLSETGEAGDISSGFEATSDIRGVSEYVSGTYVKAIAVDDAVYAMPQDGEYAGETYLLSSDDYYFSSVSVRVKDSGYEFFEDELCGPLNEDGGSIDKALYVYAWYEGGTGWEYAGKTEWDESGLMSYSFTESQIARHPWRIKAEHNCTEHDSNYNIYPQVAIKGTSPVFNKLMDGGTTQIQVENVCGLFGQAFSQECPEGTPIQNIEIGNGKYEEPGLIELTQGLYTQEYGEDGWCPMRDAAFATLQPISKNAAAYKGAASSNNIQLSRVDITYTAAAYESYELWDSSVTPYFIQSGMDAPNRDEWVFYDLLPYGVQFDPSAEVIAGKITALSDEGFMDDEAWDKSKVTATVDPANDIVQDYRQTGRTMVIFHVKYNGADASDFYVSPESGREWSGGQWFDGYGIKFGAYCEWSDMSTAAESPNIVAAMPEYYDDVPIIGDESQVSKDDGVVVMSNGDATQYAYFGPDINSDGVTGIRNVLYAQASAFDDIATASVSSIEKTVRSNEDRFGVYSKSASVGVGKRYAYNITISNSSRQKMRGIVIYDRLENAAIDRAGEEPGFDGAWWHGTLYRVDTSTLEEVGIEPTVYYNTSRDAPITSGEQLPEEVLTPENGWVEASVYAGEISDVKAIAVDISKKADGTDFELDGSGEEGSVGQASFQVYMTAPTELTESTTESLHEGYVPEFTEWAYNNPSWYSLTEGIDESDYVRHTAIGNSAKVRITESQDFEVVKEFSGTVPEQRQDEEFEFTITQTLASGGAQAYASREYALYKNEGGIWIRQNGIHATDGEGKLYLHAGEKAVFQAISSTDSLTAEETENTYWKQETDTEILDDGTKRMTFRNAFRPILYIQKAINSASIAGKDIGLDGYEFQFLVEGKDGPAADADFYYVEKAVTNGGQPSIIGTGKTDGNGVMSLKVGEVAAISLGEVGDGYKVTELDASYGEGTDWICISPESAGQLKPGGSSVSIQNIYKWKDIRLAKKITHQNASECTESFTFQVYDTTEGDGTLVTGNAWELSDGSESGAIGDDGNITAHAAGKTLIIHGLEAGHKYVVKETNAGEDYAAVNATTKELTEPLYASSVSASITNDYLPRDLEITKTVVYDASDAVTSEALGSKEFEFTIYKEDAGNGYLPYAGKEYYVMDGNGNELRSGMTDGSGKLYIKHNETAVLPGFGKEGTGYQVIETEDADYKPLSPAAGIAADGRIGAEGSEEKFVNGAPGYVILKKQWQAAGDAESQSVFNELYDGHENDDMWKVNYELLIDKHDGNGFMEPQPSDGISYQVLNQSGKTTDGPTAYTGILAGYGPNDTIMLSGALDGGWLDWDYKITESLYSEYLEDISSLKEPSMADSAVGTARTLDKSPVTYYMHPSSNGFTGSVSLDASVACSNIFEVITGSEIKKFMNGASDEIPEGALLVWRVEQYDGETWKPAPGIRYGFYNEDGFGHITDAEGKIRLAYDKEAAQGKDYLAGVRFYDSDVKLNLYSGMEEGDLRIVEVPEESDIQWGYQIGFQSEDGTVSTDILPEDAIGFVNSNAMTYIEVTKSTSSNSEEDGFTFRLSQVISSAGANETIPGAGLTYNVYGKDGEKISSAVTDPEGAFILKPGQTARIYVPKGSSWKLSETAPYPYTLVDIEKSDDKITVSGNDAYIDCDIQKHLNDYSWEEIQGELENGTFTATFAECIKNGCCKQVHLSASDTPDDYDMETSGGQTHIADQNIYVNIIGVGQDVASDAQSGQVITFGMQPAKQILTSDGIINYVASNADAGCISGGVLLGSSGAYANVSMSDLTDCGKWTTNTTNAPIMQMVLDTVYDGCLPESLKNLIICVDKKSQKGALNEGTNTFASRLFLLSADEMEQSYQGRGEASSGEYQYYESLEEEGGYSRSTEKIWTRSPSGYEGWITKESKGEPGTCGTSFAFCIRSTPDTTEAAPETKKHLDSYTWDEISDIAGKGEGAFREEFSECIENGCCKKITYGSGADMRSVYVNILGINEDVATDGKTPEGECLVTFGMQAARPVFDRFGNVINYAANTEKSTAGCMYNGGTGTAGEITAKAGESAAKKLESIYESLPVDLRGHIVYVDKQTGKGHGNTGTEPKASSLFLLSKQEISGDGDLIMASDSNAKAEPGETSAVGNKGMYSYYYSMAENDTLAQALLKSDNWWLRSPSAEADGQYLYVASSGGGIGLGAASGTQEKALSYAFCIRCTPDSYKKPIAKYAVSIYGIGQDTDIGGAIMGLTFGPALGEDYTSTYKSHTPTGATERGNAHRCVHGDSWETIISWNEEDPYVYEQCIAEGCTHAILLSENGTASILDTDGSFMECEGDGPGALYYELQYESDNYSNLRWHPNDPSGQSQDGTNAGGWGASRVRAMLNGADGATDIGVDGHPSSLAEDILSASEYTESNCLLATFPQELQDAIGMKAVRYDSDCSTAGFDRCKTSYDKLWLLSPEEIGEMPDGSSYCHPNEALEGPNSCYEKFSGTAWAGGYDPRFASYRIDAAGGGTSTSMYGSWWTRSVNNGNPQYALCVSPAGNAYGTSASTAFEIAPCFALSRDSAMVKYAVSIYGIGDGADINGNEMGLTFGPAVGGDYTGSAKSHDPSGSTPNGNDYRCMHNDSWGEIIYWNEKDPYVYSQCISEGCTHSIVLNQGNTSTMLNTSGDFMASSGDGPSALYYELAQPNADYGNLRWHPEGGVGSNEGGWGASRVRAMLNGKDEEKTPATARISDYENDVAVYTESNCLLATFPLALQGAIGERMVEYGGGTAYDKLWLLSASEAGADASGGLYGALQEEGAAMQKTGSLQAYCINNPDGGQESKSCNWWLRSVPSTSENEAFCINADGALSTDNASACNGISPCFSLPRSQIAKYAVALYGIGEDTDIDGNEMGLTFGPALGADYVNSSKSHEPTGETESGNAHRCLHNDSWATIVEWNNADPYVYEQCIAEGCTHTVGLSKNSTSTLFNEYGDFTASSGDGPATLYYELKPSSILYENLRYHPNDPSGASQYGTNRGGWGVSRARAMLNGADDATDIETNSYAIAASLDINKSAAIYTDENCLLAAFPKVLQDAIGKRETVYNDTTWNISVPGSQETTYDKLWFLSTNEMAETVSVPWADNAAERGRLYEKFAASGDLSDSTGNGNFIAYSINGENGGAGSEAAQWWPRSIYVGNIYMLNINGDGTVGYTDANQGKGVSPCFSLSRQ